MNHIQVLALAKQTKAMAGTVTDEQWAAHCAKHGELFAEVIIDSLERPKFEPYDNGLAARDEQERD